jgi:hypothetical protein
MPSHITSHYELAKKAPPHHRGQQHGFATSISYGTAATIAKKCSPSRTAIKARHASTFYCADFGVLNWPQLSTSIYKSAELRQLTVASSPLTPKQYYFMGLSASTPRRTLCDTFPITISQFQRISIHSIFVDAEYESDTANSYR